MPDKIDAFAYFARRARQEMVAAINARTAAAARAHRRLSALLSQRAAAIIACD